nr:MAG TPA: keratinocyte-associated protein [Caudoviricetes sp.]
MHELDLNFYSFIFSFIAILISLYILYKSRKRLSDA